MPLKLIYLTLNQPFSLQRTCCETEKFIRWFFMEPYTQNISSMVSWSTFIVKMVSVWYPWPIFSSQPTSLQLLHRVTCKQARRAKMESAPISPGIPSMEIQTLHSSDEFLCLNTSDVKLKAQICLRVRRKTATAFHKELKYITPRFSFTPFSFCFTVLLCRLWPLWPIWSETGSVCWSPACCSQFHL